MSALSSPKAHDPQAGARVLLVDDHATLRAALVRLIGSVAGWQAVQATDGAQALQRLADERCDVAVVDMSMPGMNGFELIERIRRDGHTLPVLMLSMHDEEPYALRAVRAGAQGYLMKDRLGDEFVPALQQLLGGGMHLSAAVAARVLSHPTADAKVAPHARLSARELEVLRRLSQGQRPTDIAGSMDLTDAVVRTCIDRIHTKLGLSSMAAIVRYGAEHGLDVPSPVPAALPKNTFKD